MTGSKGAADGIPRWTDQLNVTFPVILIMIIIGTQLMILMNWQILTPATMRVSDLTGEASWKAISEKQNLPTGKRLLTGGEPIIVLHDGGGSGCTAGIPWQTAAAYFMATARHCGQAGDRVYLTASSGELIEVGVIAEASAPEGLDAALIRLDASTVTAAVIEVPNSAPSDSPTRTLPIIGYANPENGDRLCLAGRQSGIMCGWEVLDTKAEQSIGGEVTFGVEARKGYGNCPIPGDSGGTMFKLTADGATVVGVLDATTRNEAVPFLGPCQVIIAPVGLLMEAYGGAPLVAA